LAVFAVIVFSVVFNNPTPPLCCGTDDSVIDASRVNRPAWAVSTNGIVGLFFATIRQRRNIHRQFFLAVAVLAFVFLLRSLAGQILFLRRLSVTLLFFAVLAVIFFYCTHWLTGTLFE
jgi:hypothetical protein